MHIVLPSVPMSKPCLLRQAKLKSCNSCKIPLQELPLPAATSPSTNSHPAPTVISLQPARRSTPTNHTSHQETPGQGVAPPTQCQALCRIIHDATLSVTTQLQTGMCCTCCGHCCTCCACDVVVSAVLVTQIVVFFAIWLLVTGYSCAMLFSNQLLLSV